MNSIRVMSFVATFLLGILAGGLLMQWKMQYLVEGALAEAPRKEQTVRTSAAATPKQSGVALDRLLVRSPQTASAQADPQILPFTPPEKIVVARPEILPPAPPPQKGAPRLPQKTVGQPPKGVPVIGLRTTVQRNSGRVGIRTLSYRILADTLRDWVHVNADPAGISLEEQSQLMPVPDEVRHLWKRQLETYVLEHFPVDTVWVKSAPKKPLIVYGLQFGGRKTDMVKIWPRARCVWRDQKGSRIDSLRTLQYPPVVFGAYRYRIIQFLACTNGAFLREPVAPAVSFLRIADVDSLCEPRAIADLTADATDTCAIVATKSTQPTAADSCAVDAAHGVARSADGLQDAPAAPLQRSGQSFLDRPGEATNASTRIVDIGQNDWKFQSPIRACRYGFTGRPATNQYTLTSMRFIGRRGPERLPISQFAGARQEYRIPSSRAFMGGRNGGYGAAKAGISLHL